MHEGDAPHNLLFTYGTLMSTAGGRLGADMRARLTQVATVIGPAKLSGARLHDLGRYPGLVETRDAGSTIGGELIRLRDPTESLRWLDAYEGLTPGHVRSGEYERALRTVTVVGGGAFDAWVYLYLADVSAAPVIAGGRWVARA